MINIRQETPFDIRGYPRVQQTSLKLQWLLCPSTKSKASGVVWMNANASETPLSLCSVTRLIICASAFRQRWQIRSNVRLVIAAMPGWHWS